MTELAPHTAGYPWQLDAFGLTSSAAAPPPWRRPAQPALPCLWGSLRFGDAVDDEWFAAWLLRRLTEAVPGTTARVWDNDGEFLLIEAAHALPRWLKPESAGNRLWLRAGALHLLPLPSAAAPDLPSLPSAAQALALLREGRVATHAGTRPGRGVAPALRACASVVWAWRLGSLTGRPRQACGQRSVHSVLQHLASLRQGEALLFHGTFPTRKRIQAGLLLAVSKGHSFVRCRPTAYCQATLQVKSSGKNPCFLPSAAGAKMQAAVEARLRAYPARARQNRHMARARLPAAAAAVLAAEPALAAPAVAAFYERDAADMTAAARQRRYPPEVGGPLPAAQPALTSWTRACLSSVQYNLTKSECETSHGRRWCHGAAPTAPPECAAGAAQLLQPPIGDRRPMRPGSHVVGGIFLQIYRSLRARRRAGRRW